MLLRAIWACIFVGVKFSSPCRDEPTIALYRNTYHFLSFKFPPPDTHTPTRPEEQHQRTGQQENRL